MQELIKTIRQGLCVSQDQLALMMGVSPVTISRWENGKSYPSALAQRQLADICQSHSLDMTEYIVDSCRFDESTFVLYHASRKGIAGAIKPISRRRCDFGSGFYMGTNPLQPLTLVCNEDAPILYAVTLETEGLEVLDIESDIEWAMLLAYHRGYMDHAAGTSLYEKYSHMMDGVDVVSGYIADDRMYQVLTDFFEERITDSALVASLSALDLGKQYVALTQKACDRITIHREKMLSRLELTLLEEKSIARRREGVALAEGAVKDHRRIGRYFDEILKGEYS